MELRPKVGLGVLIFKEDKILLAKRKGSHAHAQGVYSPPGGHMEYGESFEESIRREVEEECGLEIQNLKFLCVYNQKEYLPDHFVNLGFMADWKNGEPQLMEPEKMEEWGWYNLENLPQPLYAMIPKYIEALKTSKNFFDN